MAISLRKAINDHCKTCSYDPLNGGTWRQQTEACSVKSCNLYPVRPVPKVKASTGAEQPEGLRKYRANQFAEAV